MGENNGVYDFTAKQIETICNNLLKEKYPYIYEKQSNGDFIKILDALENDPKKYIKLPISVGKNKEFITKEEMIDFIKRLNSLYNLYRFEGFFSNQQRS